MRVSADELQDKQPMMVGLWYNRNVQFSYPRARPEESKLPDYQRLIRFESWAYEARQQNAERNTTDGPSSQQ